MLTEAAFCKHGKGPRKGFSCISRISRALPYTGITLLQLQLKE